MFYTLEITDRDLRVVDDKKWLFLNVVVKHRFFVTCAQCMQALTWHRYAATCSPSSVFRVT